MKVIEPTQAHGGVVEVQAAMKRIKDAVVYRRLQAILCRMQGKTIAETCREVQISRDTLHTWVRRWNQGGFARLAEAKRTGRPRKLTAEVKDLVIKEIEGRLPDGTPYKALLLHGHLKKKTRTKGRLLDPLPQPPRMGVWTVTPSSQSVPSRSGRASGFRGRGQAGHAGARSGYLVRR